MTRQTGRHHHHLCTGQTYVSVIIIIIIMHHHYHYHSTPSITPLRDLLRSFTHHDGYLVGFGCSVELCHQAESIHRKWLASRSEEGDDKAVMGDQECFQRVRIDICDLYLRGLFDALALPPHPTTFVAKHLCGVATDFALRSIEQQHNDPSLPPIKAIAIATCCQHRCLYQDYVGHDFLKQQVRKSIF